MSMFPGVRGGRGARDGGASGGGGSGVCAASGPAKARTTGEMATMRWITMGPSADMRCESASARNRGRHGQLERPSLVSEHAHLEEQRGCVDAPAHIVELRGGDPRRAVHD